MNSSPTLQPQRDALPHGWELRSIRSLVEEKLAPPYKEKSRVYQYVEIRNIDKDSGTIDESGLQRDELENLPARATRAIKRNDIVFAKTRPSPSTVAVVPASLDDEVCSNAFFVLRAKPQVDPMYLHLACRTQFLFRQLDRQQSLMIPSIREGDLLNAYIPVPHPYDPPRSLRIQSEIAARVGALLGELHAATRARASIEADVERLPSSLLAAVFPRSDRAMPEGWTVRNLHELLKDSFAGFRHEKSQASETIQYVTAGSIVEGELDWNSMLSCKPRREGDKYLARERDLLVIRSGSKAGETCVVRAPQRAVLGEHLIVLRVKEEEHVEYVHWFLRSHDARQQLPIVGSLRPSVTTEQLRSIRIPVPPAREEQQRIALRLRSVFAAAGEVREAQARCADLLRRTAAAIMEQAIQGQL